MKKELGNKIRLGIFTTSGLVLFIAAIYFVGERKQLFSNTFQVSGVFEDISGLQVGNNVRFSGINVGIVQNIKQITDSTVQVDMQIDEKAKKFIKKNAKAIIGSDGLMGNKIVSITPGSSGKPVIADYDFIETVRPISIDDIMVNVKLSSDNAVAITDNLSVMTESIVEGKGVIGKLFMDSAMGANLAGALVNIKQGAGGFKQNMDAAGHSFLLKGYFKKKEKKEKDDKEKQQQNLTKK
jgi:phospholipid/cholesterol/gamma-HCH transport system substrate-binding protein